MPLVKKALAERGPCGDGLREVLARLQSAKPDERWQAARQLASLPDTVPILAAMLASEPDEHVREAALTSLAKINSGESFAAVLCYLRADDAAIRTAALDAMKLMPERVTAGLDALLHDADADVRVLACDLARVAEAAAARPALAAILATEADINVCAAAIDLLAEIGTSETLPALANCSERFLAPFLDFSIGAASAEIMTRSPQPA